MISTAKHPTVKRLFESTIQVCKENSRKVVDNFDPTLVTTGKSGKIEHDGQFYTIEWKAMWGLEVKIFRAETETHRPSLVASSYIDGTELYPREWKEGDFKLLAILLRKLQQTQKSA